MLTIKSQFIKLRRIKTIEVVNNCDLKLVLCNVGASIFACYIKNRKVTFSPDLKEFVFAKEYFGKTDGRTSGRIKNGTIHINNKMYLLRDNKNNSPHGGGNGFAYKIYSPKITENDDEYIIRFRRVSKDRENGYPGRLINYINYHIKKNENVFIIEMRAISTKDTVCSLTNHTYWNLDGKADILSHKLKINADKMCKINSDLLKEDIIDVPKEFDFRLQKKIGKDLFNDDIQDLCNGYDHDWILNDSKDGPNVTLVSSNNDLTLNIYTSYPVCHCYTANYMNEKNKYHGIALELQKRVFDSELGSIDLNKGETYLETIKYEFKGGN